jgi:hypothetical protein
MATLASSTSKRSFNKRKHLLRVAVKGAALLGVDKVVPVVACGQHWFSGIASLLPYSIPSLLNLCDRMPPLFLVFFSHSQLLDKGGCALTAPQPTA